MLTLPSTPLATKRIFIHRHRHFVARSQRPGQQAAARICRCVGAWYDSMVGALEDSSTRFDEAWNFYEATALKLCFLPDVHHAHFRRFEALRSLVLRSRRLARDDRSLRRAEQLAKPYFHHEILSTFAQGRNVILLRELGARADEWALAILGRREARLLAKKGRTKSVIKRSIVDE